MKKLVLLSLVSLFGIKTIQAQTLTAATNNPAPGDIFYGRMCDTTGVTAGAAGAGANWNFSSLVAVDSTDTLNFVTCASTPYCDSFAGSNIAMKQDTNYVYGVTSASGVNVIGSYGSGQILHFTNPQNYLFFPMSLGVTHLDTAMLSLSFSPATLYISTLTSSTVDGSGTLQLPGATYTNVLRVHQTQTQVDSLDFMGMGSVSKTTSETYSWYVAGFHNPVLTITYDTTGATAPYVSSVEYYKRNKTAGVADANTLQGVQVYPNPATDLLHARFTSEEPTVITLTDMVGHTVATIPSEHKGANDLSYSTADLAAGMYLLHIATADGSVRTEKVTIIK